MPRPVGFTLAVDGCTLAVAGHEVANPRGAVVIAAGFGEHAARYHRLAQELAARGYETWTYDPRGHGRSTGARGHTPSWRRLVDDLDAVVGELERRRALPARRALLGHSLGGLVAADWMIGHGGEGRFHALALASPFLGSAFRPPMWKLALAALLGGVWPGFAQPTGLTGSLMTHDPHEITEYDRDPLMTRVMSARWFAETNRAQVRLGAAASATSLAGAFAGPILVMWGAGDEVADPAVTERWARTLPEGRRTLRSYPGFRHELLHELERAVVVRDLLHWLDRELPERHTPGA